MNAVLDEDGLDLGLQLSGPAQHSHGVAVGILRGALPRVDAHHHSVILGEAKGRSSVRGCSQPLMAGRQRTCRASACWELTRIFGMRRSQGTARMCLEVLLWDWLPSLGGNVTT